MSATNDKIMILAEPTPNPNSIRFGLNRTLLSGSPRDYTSADAANDSPLAQELFLISGVKGVFIGGNFVTVTLSENVWSMRPLIEGTIEAHLAAGKPVVTGESAPQPSALPEGSMEAGIQKILETEIRPAVAMDGGDVQFAGYENGIVKLHLRGSCHSCPSALFTLKGGIENRLKAHFPEIVAVEAV
ncbi:MAG TPA: NifU family protein [Planctomycetota bacterium]|nr:NifU family protein [Planctomycetota bacterium]